MMLFILGAIVGGILVYLGNPAQLQFDRAQRRNMIALADEIGRLEGELRKLRG